MDRYYSYSEIRFTASQIRWLLENLETLRDGKWPPEPVESGYVGGFSSRLQAEGKFVRPASIAAEVDWRLKQTKVDGKLLQKQIEIGNDWLEPEAYCALCFCSGWRRKTMGYLAWASKWRQRRKERNDGHE